MTKAKCDFEVPAEPGSARTVHLMIPGSLTANHAEARLLVDRLRNVLGARFAVVTGDRSPFSLSIGFDYPDQNTVLVALRFQDASRSEVVHLRKQIHTGNAPDELAEFADDLKAIFGCSAVYSNLVTYHQILLSFPGSPVIEDFEAI